MKFLKAVIYSASDLKCSKHYSVTAKNLLWPMKNGREMLLWIVCDLGKEHLVLY